MTLATPESAWIGLGSNLENPLQQIEAALFALEKLPETTLLRRSRLYQTPPWGLLDQPHFVNAVAELATSLSAPALLAEMLAIERAFGRFRDGPRWGPRVIDLDLLVYADQRIEHDGLQVPHPRIAERAFVLVPLAEVAPLLQIPGVGRVSELLARVDSKDCIPVTVLETCASEAE
ncbi:MAG: 2-amino-4-hydroxy-6-hydroxymethyldihydropteridine diphosphokinase [Dokdonella sp.]